MAATHNITAEQGATLSLVLYWRTGSGTPINITGAPLVRKFCGWDSL